MGASPASANTTHAFALAFGGETSTPANPYPLSNPTDVAVDETSGDVYVTDPNNHRVEKFDESGHLLLTFGDDVNETSGGNVCTVESGDTCQAGSSGSSSGQFSDPSYLAVDNSSGSGRGDVYVGDSATNLIQKFTPDGHILTSWGEGGQISISSLGGIGLNATGTLYALSTGQQMVYSFTSEGGSLNQFRTEDSYAIVYGVGLKVDKFGSLFNVGYEGITEHVPIGTETPLATDGYLVTYNQPTSGLAFDPTYGDLYEDTGSEINDYLLSPPTPRAAPLPIPACDPAKGPCPVADVFGSGDLDNSGGLSVDGATGAIYVANTSAGDVAVFEDIRPRVTTSNAEEVTGASATLTGTIEPSGRGNVGECRFDYGTDESYELGSLPCTPNPSANPPSTEFATATKVTAQLSGLSEGTTYHFRVTASNAKATGLGVDRSFTTKAAPSIDGVQSSDLSSTGALLEAKIDPYGSDATYHFEYGRTTEYGSTAPVPSADIGESFTDQSVALHLTDLTPSVVYHFRVVAENAFGTSYSEDQTFNFEPPECPNSNVRQETGAEFLPDCRAYELVVPDKMGNATIFNSFILPAAPYATNPARFSFGTALGDIPGSDGPNSNIDMYVATRTNTGWVSHYVGVRGNEALSEGELFGNVSFSKFIDFPKAGFLDVGTNLPARNAPYAWNVEGASLGQWPAGIGSIVPEGNSILGAFQPSPDFSHMAYSSRNVAFSPGGLTTGLGSAYDYNTETGNSALISLNANGSAIAQQAGNSSQEEFIEFPPIHSNNPVPRQDYPGVSTDGSHILMSTTPDGLARCQRTVNYLPVAGAAIYESK